MRKILKKIIRKLLPQTLCIRLNGNIFREGEVLSASKNNGNLLILRKEVIVQGRNQVMSNLYCIRFKPSKNKKWTKRRIKLFRWLAYKDLIC